ncbi:MAG: ABC transporter ATP-binding protein [Rhizobiales bacterium]|nr:ABC transporter ATP-binding protein [Hyphomicrobiales bacterium]
MAKKKGAALLEISDLDVSYGKAPVVIGASLVVHEGEFHAILGRNGAGKSTMLHAVSGLIAKRGGRVRFDGKDITSSSPEKIVELGLIQVLEGHRIFPSLSLQDNLDVAAYPIRRRGKRVDYERIYRLFPELAAKRNDPASSLSGGQQQILAVGQGILAEPRLLILDEPSGGLAPIVVDRILDVAAQLAHEGAAIILVEQLVEKALRRADTACVMDTGRIVHQGTAEEMASSSVVREIYLGHG